jgi:hypothetical protein
MTALTQNLNQVFNAPPLQYPASSAATVAASKDADTAASSGAKKSGHGFMRQVVSAPTANTNSSQNADVMGDLLKVMQILCSLETDLIQFNDALQQQQAEIGKATTAVTHSVSVQQENKIQEAADEAEKAAKEAKIMQIVGYVMTGLSIVLSAFGGAGALLMTVAMTALNQSGTMDKAFGSLSPGARIGVSLAIGVVAGGLAAGIDAGVASVSKSGASALADEAENGGKSAADQAAASFKFTALNTASQMLIQLHPILDLLQKAFGKDSNTALGLTVAITVIMSVAAAYYGGAGSAEMAPNMAKVLRLTSTGLVLSSIAEGGLQIWQGFTLRDQANTEDARAKIDPELDIIKAVNQVAQSQQQQTTTLNSNVLQQFGTELQNFAYISSPWDAAARALSGAA